MIRYYLGPVTFHAPTSGHRLSEQQQETDRTLRRHQLEYIKMYIEERILPHSVWARVLMMRDFDYGL